MINIPDHSNKLKIQHVFFVSICSTQPRCLSGQELTHRYNFNQMNLAAFEATEMKCHKMSLVIGFDCKRPLKCTNIRTLEKSNCLLDVSDKYTIEHKSKAKLRSIYDNHEIRYYNSRDRKTLY